MAISYTWTISVEKGDKDGRSDVVQMVHWVCDAVDGPYRARLSGREDFPQAADPLTPFGEITKSDYKQWVGSAAIEVMAAENIQGQKNAALVLVEIP